MLGFIVENKQQQIFEHLKKKVLLLKSVKSDFSNEEFNEWSLSLKTTHTRMDNSKIHIYHLFFDFNEKFYLT